MNIALWVLQTLLAVHTAIGAVWKFSNSAGQTMPTLKAIPDSVWLGMGVVELLCSVSLLLPAVSPRLGIATPIAAAVIAVEMLLFTGLHLSSGSTEIGPMVYWLVVAAVCLFVVYARSVVRPFES